MRMKLSMVGSSLVLPLLVSCAAAPEPPAPQLVVPAQAARVLSLPGVENVHRVSEHLYRSAQPSAEGFAALRRLGIRTVLNLREYHSDDSEAGQTDLKLLRYPMAAGSVTEQDIESCLRLLLEAEGPVLVHCWHGSDRTGIVVAAYRIVCQNWTIEQAEAEFRREEYGHHDFWYGNLTELLRGTDWAAMRECLSDLLPNAVR